MAERVALVTGVGPGTGTALVRRFAADGYRLAMLARNAERLGALAADLSGATAYPVDVTDEQALARVLDAVEADLGTPDVVAHNAVGGAFGTFLDVEPAVLERNFQVNVMAFLRLARRFAPAMASRGHGVILATGNTSALRGKADFAAFAPTKAAQRILAESMARELGPKGVHVAYIVIDAVIDVPWARARWPDAPDTAFITPASIAEEAFRVAHQPRDAWSFNVELRPFGERW